MKAADPAIFEEAYYSRLFELESTHWWALGMRAALDGLLEGAVAGHRDLQILDLGCGTGLLLQHLQPYAQPSAPIGLDSSPHALRFCRQRGATRLVQADAAAPPLAYESLDLIVSIDVIQHLAPAGADQRMLRACARLLRPGGWLYLRTNSALGHRPLAGVDSGRYRRYERRQLRIMLHEVGLQPVRATYLNCLPGLWAALVEHLRPPQQDLPAAGPRLTIRPSSSSLRRRLLLAALLLEAAWVGRLGRDLPFGHSLACLAQKQ